MDMPFKPVMHGQCDIVLDCFSVAGHRCSATGTKLYCIVTEHLFKVVWVVAVVSRLTYLEHYFSVFSQYNMPLHGSSTTWDVATTSVTCWSVSIGFVCQSVLCSRWQCWHTMHCATLSGILHVSPTCHIDRLRSTFTEQIDTLFFCQSMVKGHVLPVAGAKV